MSSLPLSNVRVLDLTTTVSGPVATLRLAQYGAEVIKIEAPAGDVLRTLGGPSPSGMQSGQYLHFNQGKRAVCLDLKAAEGREAAFRILATCDVLVTNMRQEALKRIGLDAAQARQALPRLIHCTISGYGSNGPYGGKPAYDSVIQAASGIVGLHTQRDSAASFVPLLICDHVAGEIAAGAVLAALSGRALTGFGATIEVPMFETMAVFVLQEHMSRATFRPPLGTSGDQRILNPTTRPVRTKDGWISLTANTDDQCRRMMRALGREELLDDARFRTVADRLRNLGAWLSYRDTVVLTRSTADWLREFWENDVPAMPCHSLDSLMADEHLQAVGLIREVSHPAEGTIRTIRSSVMFDDCTTETDSPAATVGRDTHAVLTDVGYGADTIADLRARRIVHYPLGDPCASTMTGSGSIHHLGHVRRS